MMNQQISYKPLITGIIHSLILSVIFFVFSLLVSPNVLAGSCSTDFGPYNPSACNDAERSSKSLNCGSGSYAYYSCNCSGCSNNYGSWSYCYGCHALGSGGQECSAGCRAGSSCPSGFSDAAGCGKIDATHPNFGCKSNQVCCKQNGTCSGSSENGPGTCAGDNVAINDPDYSVPPTRCQSGGCLYPSYQTGGECSRSKKGQQRFECYHMVCCAPGTPVAPALSSPANGSETATVNVTLSWSYAGPWGNACNSAQQFKVFLGTASDTMTAIATLPSSTLSYAVNNLTPGQRYYWMVLATNAYKGQYSPTWSFTVGGNTIRGTVYHDVNANCSTAYPTNLGGLTASWGSDSARVAANGTYTITATTNGTNSLTITPPVGFICTPSTAGCNNDGCDTKAGVRNPSSNRNFFFTQARLAWWQAVGAGVYAGLPGSAVSVRSILPNSTTDLIIPGANSIGALVHASSADPSIGIFGQVSANNWKATSQYKGKKMDYQFFAAHMGVTSSTQDDLPGSSIGKPTYDANKDFWFQSGDMSIDQPWDVQSGEKYVVFVKGNLTINANVTVQPGGFLAFIVDGGIIVNSGTTPDVTTIQGLYVTDDLFSTRSNSAGDDQQLVVEGSVVAWSGVSLERDLGESSNSTTPSEQFVYRTDLITNMPEKMKVFALRWQEVAPGTYGN